MSGKHCQVMPESKLPDSSFRNIRKSSVGVRLEMPVPSRKSSGAMNLHSADMVRWLGILVGTLRSCLRTHRELALENLGFGGNSRYGRRASPGRG